MWRRHINVALSSHTRKPPLIHNSNNKKNSLTTEKKETPNKWFAFRSTMSLLKDGSRDPWGGAIVAAVGWLWVCVWSAALWSSSGKAVLAKRHSLPYPGEEVQHWLWLLGTERGNVFNQRSRGFQSKFSSSEGGQLIYAKVDFSNERPLWLWHLPKMWKVEKDKIQRFSRKWISLIIDRSLRRFSCWNCGWTGMKYHWSHMTSKQLKWIWKNTMKQFYSSSRITIKNESNRLICLVSEQCLAWIWRGRVTWHPVYWGERLFDFQSLFRNTDLNPIHWQCGLAGSTELCLSVLQPTLVQRVLLKTFQKRSVSSPAPVTMASPSGDTAWLDKTKNKSKPNTDFMCLYWHMGLKMQLK